MILDTLENAHRYVSLHPMFARAFAQLCDLAAQTALSPGRIEIEGKALYALVVEGPGRLVTEAKLETHRAYIDIQLTVVGCDRIGWTPLRHTHSGEGFDAGKDVEFYTDAAQTWISVPAGQFAIFFPEDAHAPMANTGKPTRKLVMKVAVSQPPDV